MLLLTWVITALIWVFCERISMRNEFLVLKILQQINVFKKILFQNEYLLSDFIRTFGFVSSLKWDKVQRLYLVPIRVLKSSKS